MIEFANTLTKLIVYDATGALLDGYPVRIKYYNPDEQAWITLYEETITGGALNLTGNADDPTSAEVPYFEFIHNGFIPQLIVVSNLAGEADSSVMKVIASAPSFILSRGTFEQDFGTMWMAPADLIPGVLPRTAQFVNIASYFPVASTVVAPTPAVPIQDLYANLVSEIATASDNNVNNAYKLSNISVKLKALIHEEGSSMSASLLNLENSEHVNGDAISELVFDITPVHNREEGGIATPNLSGLTETAVRRILKSLGLKLNPVYQKKSNVNNGDSFKQFPAQGTSIQPNQLVTVIFSKNE